MILGRDIRASSKELSESMASGLMDAGVDVIDIGECGTENVYYATGELKSCGGVMVTASHNPSDYNGFKIVSENAKPISSETGLLDIRKIAESDKRLISESRGNLEQRDLNQSYVKKYDENGNVKPQEPDHWTCDKAKSAKIFKKAYDDARQDPKYRVMYKAWRKQENEMS